MSVSSTVNTVTANDGTCVWEQIKTEKTDQKFSFKVDRYPEVHGITDETTPYEIYSLFFTKELKDFVILQSNNYGKVAIKNKKGKQVFKKNHRNGIGCIPFGINFTSQLSRHKASTFFFVERTRFKANVHQTHQR
ncbi:hypothetical protein EIN_453900 [Entamoeba invadens IP1]|uniref:Uncharacterized protein n=1 Tax=Entamoeba invadens IP1 TaxID=370355 RepID=L7FLX8_ENTIV|nr:hypothetical protein EIN_453900 [Entamoeba invadens IP1]ELP89700.1 hypothetical protein EIN_453900 [Entamoeba invadens IP1]|eukprot:XP_004256471.1 hypothetical protein EIN_453900 [Entamoeba invadens IP1]